MTPASDGTIEPRAAMGLRARQREYTRSLIVAAATDLFRDVGYAAATVGQVADAAGTSRPTFYQYFSSKADLAIELLHELNRHFEAVFSRLYDLQPITLDGVRAWVKTAIELWDPANPRVSIVAQATILEPMVRDVSNALLRQNIDGIAAFLRRRKPSLSMNDARLHACHLLAEFHVLDNTHLLGVPAASKVTVHALAESWWSVVRPRSLNTLK
jgi:AcrR family transcriptional regulator